MISYEEDPRRRVVILGRACELPVEPLLRQAASEGTPVVFLSIGYPVTALQSRLVQEALDLAVDLRVAFDAILVLGPERVRDHVGADDDVSIVAAGRERRKLEGALGPRRSSRG